MPEVNSIRCSSLDSLHNCAPSVLNAEDMRIEEDRIEATTGNAVHACMGAQIETGTFDLQETCHKMRLENTDDVADMMVRALQVWGEISKFFPDAMVERRIKSDVFTANNRPFQLTGTVDVISTNDEGIIFNDWKSGWLTGCVEQMNGYAYCSWCELGKPKDAVVTGIVSWLRHRFYRINRWTAAELETWHHNLTHNVLSKPGQYKTGDHCRFCTLYHTCPARREAANASIQVMMLPRACPKTDPYRKWIEQVHRTLATLTPENKTDPIVGPMILELMWRVKLANSAVADLDGLLREAIQRVGGIPLADGRTIRMVEGQVRNVVPDLAMPVLRKILPERAITDAMRLSIGSLSAAVAALAGKGEKKSAKANLENELNKAGAIELSVRRTLEIVDPDRKELPE